MALKASITPWALTCPVLQKIRLELGSVVWDRVSMRQTGGVMNIGHSLVSSSIFGLTMTALDTTKVTDAGSTRTVMIVAGLLVLFAFVLLGVTIWFWRNTVPDPEVLEPLAYFEERVIDHVHDTHVEPRRRRSREKSSLDRHPVD